MRQIIVFTIVNFILCLYSTSKAQVIWEENFPIPNKGYWVEEPSVLKQDTEGIPWSVDVSQSNFVAPGDYAMTVSTSGGRFEVLDSDGDVTWKSPVLDVSMADAVKLSFIAGESGSSSSSIKKYVKPFISIDGKDPVPLSADSVLSGNWGERYILAEGFKGNSLQLVFKFNSSLSNDKVFIDDIKIISIDSSKLKADRVILKYYPSIAFKGEKIIVEAECFNGYNEIVKDSSIDLSFSCNDCELINQHYSDGLYSWIILVKNAGIYDFKVSSDNYLLKPDSAEICVSNFSEIIFSEDFESSYLDSNVILQWEISSILPIYGDKSLKHIEQGVPGEGIYSFFDNGMVDFNNAEYIFSFKVRNGEWDPTSSNGFYFSLGYESNDSTNQNAYIIGVNAKGSSDKVSLWKLKNGKINTMIAESDYEWNENSAAQIIIKRLSSGQWILTVVDLVSGLRHSASGNDDETFLLNAFTFNFKYSQSRSGLLWLDDILLIRKNLPPFIKSVLVMKDGTVKLGFNESVRTDNISSSDISLKNKKGSIINTESFSFLNDSTLIVGIEDEIPDSIVLSINHLTDIEGGTNDSVSITFLYQLPVEMYDVVFTEIMCDPDPSAGLPEAEFIELANVSDKIIDLGGWNLSVKDKAYSFPEDILFPSEYAILCHPADSSLFAEYGKVISISRFPSLTNSGSFLSIYSPDNETIDELTYSDKWYFDSEKNKGGFSLEKKNPTHNCGNTNNWAASNDVSGGTPGRVNSLNCSIIDSIPPFIVSSKLVSPSELVLYLSEPIDTNFLINNYSIESKDLTIDSVSFLDDFQCLKFNFKDAVKDNISCSVLIKNISDDCGNTINITHDFIKSKLEYGDILINEVLFNPYPGGSDFVELYNNSGKDIDIAALSFASRDDSLKLKSVYEISNEMMMFKHGDYLAFTSDLEGVLPFYSVLKPDNIIEVESLPSMNDDGGIIVLVDDSLNVIDEFEFNKDMHDSWISDKNGVSLERSSLNLPSCESSNWHSAASLSGYATPGYENSEKEFNEETGLTVSLSPKAISPNGDGNNDEMQITFNSGKPGYLVNGFVFDISGREMRRLLNNEVLGTKGTITFNGADNNDSRLSPGIYIILFEMLHRDGKRIIIKKSCFILE